MATWVDIDDVHFTKIREVAIVTENMRKRSECKGSVHDQAKKFLTVMDMSNIPPGIRPSMLILVFDKYHAETQFCSLSLRHTTSTHAPLE